MALVRLDALAAKDDSVQVEPLVESASTARSGFSAAHKT